MAKKPPPAGLFRVPFPCAPGGSRNGTLTAGVHAPGFPRGSAPDPEVFLRRGALLHDHGKLGVSNRSLDKPGRLTPEERAVMQGHPEHGERILSQVSAFAGIAHLAGAHHERLDGKGYYRGLRGEEISPVVRCLVVADMCAAISARRPYRDTLPIERVLEILRGEVGDGICPDAFAAVEGFVRDTGFRSRPDWWLDEGA